VNCGIAPINRCRFRRLPFATKLKPLTGFVHILKVFLSGCTVKSVRVPSPSFCYKAKTLNGVGPCFEGVFVGLHR